MYIPVSSAVCHGWRLFFCLVMPVVLLVMQSTLARPAQDEKPHIVVPVKPLPPDKTTSPPPPKKMTDTAVKPSAGSFSGDRLVAPDWEMVNADSQRWTMHSRQKSLFIQTQNGSLSDSKDLKNQLTLKRDLPADDFEVIVEASIQIQGVGNQVAIALVGDDKNYFTVGFQGPPLGYLIRQPYLSKVFQGKTTSFGGQERGGPTPAGERIFLKIDREEDNYSGSYAYEDQPTPIDQVKWVKMGTLPWINFHGKLVLCAANFQDAPEVAAEFYSVLIRKK